MLSVLRGRVSNPFLAGLMSLALSWGVVALLLSAPLRYVRDSSGAGVELAIGIFALISPALGSSLTAALVGEGVDAIWLGAGGALGSFLALNLPQLLNVVGGTALALALLVGWGALATGTARVVQVALLRPRVPRWP